MCNFGIVVLGCFFLVFLNIFFRFVFLKESVLNKYLILEELKIFGLKCIILSFWILCG